MKQTMTTIMKKVQANLLSMLSNFKSEYDSKTITTQFESLSKIWPIITKLMVTYANRVELATACLILLYYRKSPSKMLYMIGILVNLSWLRRYIREVASEKGDRLSGSMRFNVGYSVVDAFIKLKGDIKLHIPIVGTFHINACFDSIDYYDNKQNKHQLINTISNKSTIDGSKDKPEQLTKERHRQSSFDSNKVVPELINFWNYRKDQIAQNEHRDSLESVISQIAELKPYLQAEEKVYRVTNGSKNDINGVERKIEMVVENRFVEEEEEEEEEERGGKEEQEEETEESFILANAVIEEEGGGGNACVCVCACANVRLLRTGARV